MKILKYLKKNKKLFILLNIFVGLIILVGAVELVLWLNDKPPAGWHDASDIKINIDGYETSLQSFISNKLRTDPAPTKWDDKKEFFHTANEIRIEENGNYTSLDEYIKNGYNYNSKSPWEETSSWHEADKIRVNYKGKHYSLQELADHHSLRDLLQDGFDIEFYQGDYLDNVNRINPEKNRIKNNDLKGNPNADKSDCSIDALSARRPYVNAMCEPGSIAVGIAYKKTSDVFNVGVDRTDAVSVVCSPFNVKEDDREIIVEFDDTYVAGESDVQEDFLTRYKMHNIYRDTDYSFWIIKNVLPTVIESIVTVSTGGGIPAFATGQVMDSLDIRDAVVKIIGSFANPNTALCMDNPFYNQRYTTPTHQLDMSGIQEVNTDACAANCHNSGSSCTGTIPSSGSKPTVECGKQCLPITVDTSLGDDFRALEGGTNPNKYIYQMCPNNYEKEDSDYEEDVYCEKDEDCKSGENCNIETNKCELVDDNLESTGNIDCEEDEDCKSGENCNIETNKCESSNEDNIELTGNVINGFVSKIVGFVTENNETEDDKNEKEGNYVLIGIKYSDYWEDETLTCRMCSTDDVDSYTAICAKIDKKGMINYNDIITVSNSDLKSSGSIKSLKCDKGKVVVGISTKDRTATKGFNLFGECRGFEVDQNDGATPVCIEYHPFN